MSDKVIVDVADGVGTITLNRPGQHNAIDFEMWGLLRDAALRLGADDGVRVVILTGAGTRHSRRAPTSRTSPHTAATATSPATTPTPSRARSTPSSRCRSPSSA